jgi:hypothetical protein
LGKTFGASAARAFPARTAAQRKIVTNFIGVMEREP